MITEAEEGYSEGSADVLLCGWPDMCSDELRGLVGGIGTVTPLDFTAMNTICMSNCKFGQFLVGHEVRALLAIVTEVDDEMDRDHVVPLKVFSVPEFQPMKPEVPVHF